MSVQTVYPIVRLGDISGMESSPSLSARNSGAQSRNVDRLKNLKKSGSAGLYSKPHCVTLHRHMTPTPVWYAP